MKLFFAIEPKFKMALILMLLVSIILSAILVGRIFNKNINQSSASIFNDRLLPANEMFHLADNMTQRHLLLLNHDKNLDSLHSLQNKLKAISLATDSIINDFEQTYLVPSETKSLENLRNNMQSYAQIEQLVLDSKNQNNVSRLQSKFQLVRQDLITLSGIQIKVGKDLLLETENSAKHVRSISDIQIIVILVLCILAQMFLLASKSLKSPLRQKHHLN